MLRHDVLGGFSHLLQSFSVMGDAIFDRSRQEAFLLFLEFCLLPHEEELFIVKVSIFGLQ